MAYAEIPPDPSLETLVACYWAIAGAHATHRVLPDGCIDVVVFGGEGARVVGTMSTAIVVPPSDARHPFVGVRFMPGEAARLLPAAPHELTNDSAPLADLWRDGREIEDALLAAVDDPPSSPARLLARVKRTLDAILRARLASHGGAVDLRVRAAAGALTAGASVKLAADRVSLSERQLARRFVARVGVAPKTFARVMRLSRAATAIRGGASLLDASVVAGYADQAHFTRDSRELAGVTPSVLAKESRNVDR